jgi:23S rRNA (guanine2445-N2)-methyltransferase / 23S rRNA (guanine2069-N7)-methyltransferase
VQKNYHLAEKAADSKPSGVAEDYANRLRKNLKKFEKWARQEGIECYRLYDADLPEYNVASTATPTGWWFRSMRRRKPLMQKARQRLLDIIAATIAVLGIAPNKLVLKTRERQKGKTSIRRWARRATLSRWGV